VKRSISGSEPGCTQPVASDAKTGRYRHIAVDVSDCHRGALEASYRVCSTFALVDPKLLQPCCGHGRKMAPPQRCMISSVALAGFLNPDSFAVRLRSCWQTLACVKLAAYRCIYCASELPSIRTLTLQRTAELASLWTECWCPV